jgi:hypothetical protein
MFKEFRTTADGKTVNKCFPGLAILWLPFFLAAHLLSLILGFAPDGYSILYQLAIAAAALFYLWLGCRILFRLLVNAGASVCLSGWITVVTGLGTNLIFFTIVEGSMTHVYSFAVVTAFLFCLERLFRTAHPWWFLPAAGLFGLMVIIRPTNGILLLMVPFFSNGWKHFKEIAGKMRERPATLFFGFILLVNLLCIPVAFWQAKTGQWIINPYGNEFFDFRNPHFFSILFSYNRGWFLYTPVAFASMAGFIGLFRESRWKFSWLLGFLVVFTFIASSWWMWYYASKCGQRVFIDIYAVVALLMLFLYRSTGQAKTGRALLNILLGILLVLNLFQFYQHARFIFPATVITRTIYRDSFFRIHPIARVYLPPGAVAAKQEIFLDMETGRDCINPQTFTAEMAFRGTRSSKAWAGNDCSAGISEYTGDRFTTANRAILVSAMVNPAGKAGWVILVFDFCSGDSSLCYCPVYLNKYARKNRWTQVEAAVYVPALPREKARVRIYFYNPSGEPVFLDDMRIAFLSLKEDREYREIEEILVPCR